MPEKSTIERAKKALKQGKKPTTAAGEFVREEVEHIRQGKHGARSAKQAVAIGLSKARRAGIPLPPKKSASTGTRRSARLDTEVGQGKRQPRAPSRKRSTAISGVLRHESRAAASPMSLSRQTRQAAKKRSPAERSRAAKKTAETKGPAVRSRAATKAASTRRRSR